MIESLIVKNFALIKEAHIDFKNNLNVITGETGSGKSILLGSINLVLGKRQAKIISKKMVVRQALRYHFILMMKRL